MILRTLALASALLIAACDDRPGTPQVGESLRSFSAGTLSGDRIEIPAAASGKVVVLSFWATWCAWCKDEMRAVEAIWADNRDKGLLVLAVNAGQSIDDIRGFVAELRLSYPILLDPDSSITRAWGISGLPMAFVIDRDGKVRNRIRGEADAAAIRRLVEGAL